MSAIIDVRDAIVATIKEAIPGLRMVVGHAGRFDTAEELLRIITQAPAVLVSCLAVNRVDEQGGVLCPEVRWVAYVVTRDAPKLKKDVSAVAIIEQLVRVIAGNRWGIDGTHRPRGITGENLYSGAIDSLGVAIWAVPWQQGLDLPADAADLPDLVCLHTDFDLAPGDGSADVEGEAPLFPEAQP